MYLIKVLLTLVFAFLLFANATIVLFSFLKILNTLYTWVNNSFFILIFLTILA